MDKNSSQLRDAHLFAQARTSSPNLHHKPFTITLGYIDGKEESKDEKIIILDPNRHEQNILGGSISIAVNKHREVSYF